MKSHAAFCRQLMADFCGEITGEGIDILEGIHPQDRFLVGMISPRAETQENSVGSSSVIVSQIGLDFFIPEAEVENTTVFIEPRGDLFYRAMPTLEQQQRAFLREQELLEIGACDIESAYHLITDVQSGNGMKPLAVYKRIKLQDIISDRIAIKLSDVYDASIHSGRIDEMHPINVEFQASLINKAKELGNAEDAYHKYTEHVHLEDVLDSTHWATYLHRAIGSDSKPEMQTWYFSISCDMQRVKDGSIRVSIKLLNNSTYQANVKKGSKAKKEAYRVNDLFNACISVTIDGAEPLPTIMEFFHDDYKYDREQYAIGSGCSVIVSDDHRRIETTQLPIYEQHRLKTRPNTEVSFDSLIHDCIQTLSTIHHGMEAYLSQWKAKKQELLSANRLTPKGADQFSQEIQDFQLEIDRFAFGISILNTKYVVRKAFEYMNMAFKNSAKGYTGWRLFQIVFAVSLIPDIASCEKDLLTSSELKKTHLEEMDLLYFPTGGGKTEAFLGVLVFNLFFDRLRGKHAGVTAVLKYPLRLLSVQQVQRVADILAQAEMIRISLGDDATGDPFAVGYYVGDNNTPNRIEPETHTKLQAMLPIDMDKEYKIVDRCPYCGKVSIHVQYDSNQRRLIHKCDNPECPSGGELPVYIVDTDVYRYLPSVIISTIDKMAAIGNNRRFKNLFGSVAQKCPCHGYHEIGLCEEKDCCEVQEDVNLYDAAPTLFIQDELHLVRESLGTYDAHYESLIQYMISELSESKRPAKIIGATATISSYENQVLNLYNRKAIRFPCASPYVDENYYAAEDKDDLHRLILGYTPFGRAIINSVAYSMKAMRVCINKYRENPALLFEIPNIGINDINHARKIVEDYWIMLQYNNVKVDGNNVLNALDDPINTELTSEGIPAFDTRKMTGDDTFQDVRKTLAEVENTKNVFDGFNLIVATSMISHGVDADRFNNMMFFGIPGNMAEYIQAYSRVGRKYAGMVVDIIRPTREREISWQKNFTRFHAYKDILVDPVPINRWASRAIEQTLPGLFTGLILNHYTWILREKREKIYMMNGLKKALEEGWITRDEVKHHLFMIYGCGANGTEFARGNQYRKKISDMVDVIFDRIGDSIFDNKTYLTSGIAYRVMNSLRDTDAGLSIELH